MSNSQSGQPWTDREIAVVVDAYVDMLAKQERHEPFTKAEIRRSIASALPARSSKSIDLKWCNISAVLAQNELPWVDGLKPLAHMQGRLREIVQERFGLPAPPTDPVAARMRNTPQKDTRFEVAVKGLLRDRDVDFREDEAVGGVSRSRPDLLFPEERLAVYLDGCFWHWCREHFTMPAHNRGWWFDKLMANVQRDRRHVREYAEAGWVVLRFWEHEPPHTVTEVIEKTLVSLRR